MTFGATILCVIPSMALAYFSSPVHEDVRSGHEGVFTADDKTDDGGNLFDLADPLHGVKFAKEGLDLVNAAGEKSGRKDVWCVCFRKLKGLSYVFHGIVLCDL